MKLRRLMNLGQIVQSHALSFFHLSLARSAARLRRRPGAAQHLRPDRGEPRAGARRHPPAPVRPGDHRVARRPADPPGLGRARRRRRGPCRPRARDRSCAALPEARRDRPAHARLVQADARRASREEVAVVRQLPDLFLGLVGRDGDLEHLRRPAALRRRRRAQSSPTSSTRPTTSDFIGEAVEPWIVSEVALLQAARLPGRRSTASGRWRG